MRISSRSVLVAGLLSTCVPTYGKQVDLIGRPKTPKTPQNNGRREMGPSPLRDGRDIIYYTNVTLGGIQVEVQIDTGR
jgi:hypothetical protein